MLKRTVNCGELRKNNSSQNVILNGWVNRRRDLGGLIFIDLRDRYGTTQIVFDPENGIELLSKAKKIGLEDVIAIKGIVRERPVEATNKDLKTASIEILVEELEILSKATPLPFLITDRTTALEDLRLKYRYLELRTKELQKTLAIRHKAAQVVRNFYTKNSFYEIETPVLMKSTPEGARDYLVPSRIHKGQFYALPQSPQTYKQLLMLGGFDRYFQIVKCFRDEDLRADRQPEFTQIDVEMSFIDEEDIIQMTEKMLKTVFKQVIDVELEKEFPRIDYSEAMLKYGSDKPDLRFGYEIHSINDLIEDVDFRVFQTVLKNDGAIAGICVPEADKFSRKIIDQLTEKTTKWGAKGLAFTKVRENKFESGIAKFLNPVYEKMITKFEAKPGDILFFVADKSEITYPVLGRVRLELGKFLDVIEKHIFKPLWVTRFPLLEWNDDEKRYLAKHHPFTSYLEEDGALLEKEPGKVRARAYDIVINGYEIGGGSIRNHTSKAQSQMFDILGISKKEAEDKFGFLLEALTYGTPPHGGIALGFDRLIMILAEVANIREVIAFPKTTSASSLMDGCPTTVDNHQLEELGLQLKK